MKRLILVALVLGCGSSAVPGGTGGAGTGGAVGTGGAGTGGVTAAPAAVFTGTWSAISGGSLVCSDGSSGPLASRVSQVLITKGTASDLVRAAVADMTCPIPLNIIGGSRASLAGGATCTLIDANGNSDTLILTAWSFDLIDPHSASETGTGTIALPAAGASCTASIATSLVR